MHMTRAAFSPSEQVTKWADSLQSNDLNGRPKTAGDAVDWFVAMALEGREGWVQDEECKEENRDVQYIFNLS